MNDEQEKFNPLVFWNWLVVSRLYALMNETDRIVIGVLFAHANESGQVWATLPTLATESGRTRRVVQKSLKRHRLAGMLKVGSRWVNGKQHNFYTLCRCYKSVARTINNPDCYKSVARTINRGEDGRFAPKSAPEITVSRTVGYKSVRRCSVTSPSHGLENLELLNEEPRSAAPPTKAAAATADEEGEENMTDPEAIEEVGASLRSCLLSARASRRKSRHRRGPETQLRILPQTT